MKAFEKWNNEHYFVPQTTADTPLWYWDAFNERKMIWRAALKEALKHKTDNQSTEIGDWIRKELSE